MKTSRQIFLSTSLNLFYDAFTFDITPALRPGETQEVVVSVLDPTDEGSKA